MMKSFLPEFTVEEIKELYAESTPCSIILNNSDNWLGLGYETNTHLIMFNPVLIDGYIDDDSLYQYFLRPINYTSTDNMVFLPKQSILYANNMDDQYKEGYLKYQAKRIAALKELEDAKASKEESDDQEIAKKVVPIGKKLH